MNFEETLLTASSQVQIPSFLYFRIYLNHQDLIRLILILLTWRFWEWEGGTTQLHCPSFRHSNSVTLGDR
jgi:hypothetical protein